MPTIYFTRRSPTRAFTPKSTTSRAKARTRASCTARCRRARTAAARSSTVPYYRCSTLKVGTALRRAGRWPTSTRSRTRRWRATTRSSTGRTTCASSSRALRARRSSYERSSRSRSVYAPRAMPEAQSRGRGSCPSRQWPPRGARRAFSARAVRHRAPRKLCPSPPRTRARGWCRWAGAGPTTMTRRRGRSSSCCGST